MSDPNAAAQGALVAQGADAAALHAHLMAMAGQGMMGAVGPDGQLIQQLQMPPMMNPLQAQLLANPGT